MNVNSPARHRGIALPVALALLVTITLVMVTIAYRSAQDELASANQRDGINAMSVAESGIEHGYALVKNNYVVNRQFSDALFNLPGGTLATGNVSGGSYVVIVGRITQQNGNVVVLMNSTGSYNGATREIDIMLEMVANPSASFAILTNDDINAISGNMYVYGTYADVHSNADVIISGNPTIDGTVSASGDVLISGDPNLGGEVSGAAGVEIPHIYPPEYEQYHTIRFTADCLVQTASGSIIADASANKWHGWDCSRGDKWTMGDSTPVGGLYEAFYYIEGNVVLSGSPSVENWYATFVAEGYIEVSGNLQFRPWGAHPDYTTGDDVADAILFYAGNDLKINGNPDQAFFGIAAAHMDVAVSGNPYLEGSIVAENGLYGMGQQITTGQLVKNIVDMNYFSGDLILNASGAMSLNSGEELKATAWRERVD